ncbi:MAG: hypothetical protein A4E34_00030 [Methanoregula sp. PtaU1.Bin006]|uniref:hypothetical protein n=1 Tax=Methanoregula sp. PtaU1.Bin006 TaxID=1811681 RepID=UPI0009D0339F|nr:hypothetical protein [Methanoregula sp. PtaU1.Bin006]OPY37237.1 MAG: hypothetical protein A4E34_00030 [Methanoregula sp. PtaU1.Bin006]
MDTSEFNDIVSSALQCPPLSSEQQKNVKDLIDVSKKFHTDARLSPAEYQDISADFFVLESGHQPNFIPYAGIWKKAFLLHYISSIITKAGKQSCVFYGFADQNLSTASLLFRNQIPALNKTGSEKIGLKKIDDTNNKWKCFNRIEKPPLEVWQAEIEKIENYYKSNSDKLAGGPFATKDDVQIYVDMLWKSYNSAATLSDLNAFFFAKVCDEILQLKMYFFRYSDVQKHRLFSDEWKKILHNLNTFNATYNRAITDFQLDINQVSRDMVPFWYHCDCGGKLLLNLTDHSTLTGTCPVCRKEYDLICYSEFSDINSHLDHMGFNAVTRNVIMSEGIGTSIFVSGSGGSLKYSTISDAISRELNLHIPLTISWISRDYYLGLVHKNGIQDLMKMYKISLDDIISSAANDKINHHVSGLKKDLESVNGEKIERRMLKIRMNTYNNFLNLVHNVKMSFAGIPSMIDLFASMDSSEIIDAWSNAIEHASVEKKHSRLVKIKKDICYEDKESGIKSNDMRKIYDGIAAIRVP